MQTNRTTIGTQSMKTAQVNKLYGKLTPHEQAALVFEAPARLDSAEVDAILRNVEKREYICPHADYQRRAWGLRNLVGIYGTQYWKMRALLLMAVNLEAEGQNAAKILLSKIASLEAALFETCNHYKVDIDAVKKLAECFDEAVCLACKPRDEWTQY